MRMLGNNSKRLRAMNIDARRFSNNDIKKLVIPLMCEQFLAVSVGLVATLMVSRAGDAAISGVALVDSDHGCVCNRRSGGL
jgi:Na+-driven multidrug efflux pump